MSRPGPLRLLWPGLHLRETCPSVCSGSGTLIPSDSLPCLSRSGTPPRLTPFSVSRSPGLLHRQTAISAVSSQALPILPGPFGSNFTALLPPPSLYSFLFRLFLLLLACPHPPSQILPPPPWLISALHPDTCVLPGPTPTLSRPLYGVHEQSLVPPHPPDSEFFLRSRLDGEKKGLGERRPPGSGSIHLLSELEQVPFLLEPHFPIRQPDFGLHEA